MHGACHWTTVTWGDAVTRRNAEGGSAASTAVVFGELLKHFREAGLFTQRAIVRLGRQLHVCKRKSGSNE